jgi:hypothetical protein
MQLQLGSDMNLHSAVSGGGRELWYPSFKNNDAG